MKEATGEFSMTLVVIVGAILVVGILTYLFTNKEGSPVRKYIEDSFKSITGVTETKPENPNP